MNDGGGVVILIFEMWVNITLNGNFANFDIVNNKITIDGNSVSALSEDFLGNQIKVKVPQNVTSEKVPMSIVAIGCGTVIENCKSLIVLLSALGLLCFPSFFYGQDDPNLKEFDNRYEGKTTQQISGSADLKLISFISYFQDFDWYKDQNLFIRFQLEETKPVNILVQQTKGNIIYRMKPKEFPTAKGPNEFGPWPVDDVLSTLELRKDNLGITITDGTESTLYPATIFSASDSIDSRNYLFQFLPGTNLTKVKFSLYQGLYKDKEINTDSLIYAKDFKDRAKHGGEPFQLFIEKKDLDIDPNWKGWLTLTMKAKDRLEYTDVEALYFFYHSPDIKTND